MEIYDSRKIVSRRHGSLFLGPWGVTYTDTNSTNGSSNHKRMKISKISGKSLEVSLGREFRIVVSISFDPSSLKNLVLRLRDLLEVLQECNL